MKSSAINPLATAMERAATATAAANQELLAALKTLPGGENLLRGQLAHFNLDPTTFERLLRGDVLPSDAAILAGLKIGQS